MHRIEVIQVGAAIGLLLASPFQALAAGTGNVGSANIKHVLLISIDGMHAVDFYNCANGMPTINDGYPYCPNLAALAQTGINYVNTTSSKPSDSYPGIAALVTGGTPNSTGLYYDVAFDRSLDPPQNTTGTGLAGGACTPYAAPTGTTTDNDQGIDFDDTKLNGGAPGAALTEGGIASIDPTKLSRDPLAGCAPVWPWNFLRVNTVFGVVRESGGYTAWIDKHPSYATVAGPGGYGLNDYFSPEVSSNVVPLPGVVTAMGNSCAKVRDPLGVGAWNSSFENIQCYDAIKVNGLLNQIAGLTHNGKPAQVPNVFGMNFQQVYVGQSVNEPGVGSGGYVKSAALPSLWLMREIQSVDVSIGQIVNALKDAGIYENTLILVTAKHGEGPIDPTRYVANGANTPATLLGSMIPFSESPLNSNGIGATEDDVSVLWLNRNASVPVAVGILEKNGAAIGLGEILYGSSLAVNFNQGGWEPGQDSRAPDIIVTPNLGMTYSGSTTMIGDHGGFAHDDNNVILLVSNARFTATTVSDGTTTSQVAPTILTALGLDPASLDAVNLEGTQPLPGVAAQIVK